MKSALLAEPVDGSTAYERSGRPTS